jgi:hypothetical protein
MAVQVRVGQVIMVAGMGRMRANLLWEGACWEQCLALMVCVIVMKICLRGGMRVLASVVYDFDIMVSVVHIAVSTLKESIGRRTESLASSSSACVLRIHQQRWGLY